MVEADFGNIFGGRYRSAAQPNARPGTLPSIPVGLAILLFFSSNHETALRTGKRSRPRKA